MNRGALTALLGALAVAGYQNRDKIRDMLSGLRQGNPGFGNGGLGGLLGGLPGSTNGLGGLLEGSSVGQILSNGLGSLVEHFRQNGHEDTANSWIGTGPNTPIDDQQLSQALGPEILQELSARTGLSPEEITSRLSRELPKAVDDLTPDGRLPEVNEPSRQSVPSVSSSSPSGI